MELLEDVDSPVELKVPLPNIEHPETAILGAIDKDVEGTPVPGTKEHENVQSEVPAADLVDETSQQPKEDSHEGVGFEPRETTNVQQFKDQRPGQASEGSVQQSPIIRINDVKDLINRDEYQRSQAVSLQTTLDNHALADGLNRRLIPSLGMAFQEMANCYHSGDQAAFASLYQTCEDLSKTRTSYAIGMSPTATFQPLVDPDLAKTNSWLERLFPDHQDVILDFITRLRTDDRFLADRLSALSFCAFAELLSYSPVANTHSSAMGAFHQRQMSGHHRKLSSLGSVSALERLRQSHQGDPLFVLFHVIFDNSYGPGTKEYHRKVQVWSSACARIISEGKPGSDALTLASLDAFAVSSPWRLASQIESYIAVKLQEGAFMVDPTVTSPDNLKESPEIRNANIAIATSKFFDKALKDLFAILLNHPPVDMIPDGLLHFSHSILLNISNIEIRSRARKFIASKWFISSFLGRVLTYPEVS
ncbi:MAG: hypothetical protein Q9170_005283 [Blastenia crenularia]